jgi:hypothetical protein
MNDAEDFGGPAYQQARRLYDQGRFDAALLLFAESARIHPHSKTPTSCTASACSASVDRQRPCLR